SDPALRAQLRRLLTECGSVEVVGECDAATASRMLATLRPDVLVTEVSAAGESEGDPGPQIERLARLFPSLTIVANGPRAPADSVRRGIRAGAVEYVPRPLRRDDVAAALDKITRVRQGRPAGGPGRITAVFSRKGGLGATTLAVNLAASLAA